MVYGLGAVLILHFLAACGVMEIVWQIGKRVCKGEKSVKVLRFLYQSCIIGFLTVVVAAGYGSYNIKNVRQTDYNLTTKKQVKNCPDFRSSYANNNDNRQIQDILSKDSGAASRYSCSHRRYFR